MVRRVIIWIMTTTILITSLNAKIWNKVDKKSRLIKSHTTSCYEMCSCRNYWECCGALEMALGGHITNCMPVCYEKCKE